MSKIIYYDIDERYQEPVGEIIIEVYEVLYAEIEAEYLYEQNEEDYLYIGE